MISDSDSESNYENEFIGSPARGLSTQTRKSVQKWSLETQKSVLNPGEDILEILWYPLVATPTGAS